MPNPGQTDLLLPAATESLPAGVPSLPVLGEKPYLSVVIPYYNEAGSLPELYERLVEVLEAGGHLFELVFVDDGSTDGSLEALAAAAGTDPRCERLRFRRNLGKAAALAVGFQHSRGDVIVTMDADLQDDPSEIPRLLEKLESGWDLVSGWKKERRDPLHKTLPSLLFNRVTRAMTGLEIHDFNCGLKIYRRSVVRRVNLYGELHRYIPALAHWKGFRVTEIPVTHHARRHGQSKYGFERFLRGMFDLLTIVFLTRYTLKPLHFFGSAGALLFLGGSAANAYLAYLHFQGEQIHDRPLLVLGVLMMILGVQFVSTGLLAELIVSQRGLPEYDDFLVE
jgi:glycosyltransferase involved in cell wall biosynthesis